MVLTFPKTSRVVGADLSIVQAQQIRSLIECGSDACYLAVARTHENIRRLVLALHSPGSTWYAYCDIGIGEPGIAVPFSAIQEDMQYLLPDCMYLFREEALPSILSTQLGLYEIAAPFTAQEGAGLFKVPLHFAPPWEGLPPAYVCCPARDRDLLEHCLLPEAKLHHAVLLVEDRLPAFKAYVAVAIGDLRGDALSWLERVHRKRWTYLSCLYACGLEGHPLFPFLAWRERCQIEQSLV